jgi:hypothetical protein
VGFFYTGISLISAFNGVVNAGGICFNTTIGFGSQPPPRPMAACRTCSRAALDAAARKGPIL